jgi:hypothetical protein
MLELLQGWGRRAKSKMMEGMNSTMTYHKNFCKCNVPQYNNNIIKKKKPQK